MDFINLIILETFLHDLHEISIINKEFTYFGANFTCRYSFLFEKHTLKLLSLLALIFSECTYLCAFALKFLKILCIVRFNI